MKLEECVVACPNLYHMCICKCVGLEEGKVESHWFRWGPVSFETRMDSCHDTMLLGCNDIAAARERVTIVVSTTPRGWRAAGRGRPLDGPACPPPVAGDGS